MVTKTGHVRLGVATSVDRLVGRNVVLPLVVQLGGVRSHLIWMSLNPLLVVLIIIIVSRDVRGLKGAGLRAEKWPVCIVLVTHCIILLLLLGFVLAGLLEHLHSLLRCYLVDEVVAQDFVRANIERALVLDRQELYAVIFWHNVSLDKLIL